MTQDSEAMGPVSYLVVRFPGNKMTGEGWPPSSTSWTSNRSRPRPRVRHRDTDGSITAMELRTSTATASSTSRS
jgi:hypothetical protein